MLDQFAGRLFNAMKKRGISQTDLADAIGVTAPTVNRYIHGHREPSLSLLARIATAVGVSTDYLIMGKGEIK